MEVDEIMNNEAESTSGANANFAVRINSPVTTTSRNNSVSDDALFSEPGPAQPPLSPPYTQFTSSFARKLFNGKRRIIDSTILPGPSSLSNTSDLPGPSTSYASSEVVDSTEKTEGSIQNFFRDCESFDLLDDTTSFSNDERRPSNSIGRNAISDADTIRRLCESSSVQHYENNNFSENQRHLDVGSSRNYDPPSAEQSDNADHLFAPEESSSSSSENSQSDVPNPFLAQSPSSSYFKFLNHRRSAVDEYPLTRSSPRYRRFFRPPLALHLSNESNSLDRDSQLRLGSTQRLSSYLRDRAMLSPRYRIRFNADLLAKHKTVAALNAVTSNDESSSLTNGNDFRELNARTYRRKVCLPKFNNESRFHPGRSYVPPSECDTSRCRNPRDRLFNGRSPAILQSLIEFDNSLRAFARSVPSARARSVSPTPATLSFPASVHDDALDDISINLQSDSSCTPGRTFLSENTDDQIQRPSTPVPPTLSDDDSPSTPMMPNNFENEIMSLQTPVETRTDNCHQSVNLQQRHDLPKKHTKEAPRTYDELNNELIQLLECPICFEYTTPPVNQCLQGHIICNNCRQRVTTCPTCRTIFQESRNLIMEKVAALLRYPCKNAVTGCLEFLYLLQKEQHEMNCGFRQYACFISLCSWRGYKPELLVHVQERHEKHVIHGGSVDLLIPIIGQTKKVWLMSAFNELFYVTFFTTLGILKGCVRFIGDASKCDNYTYNISVTSEQDMLRNFNYTRTTHAYEETFENIDMIDSYDLFSISHAQLNLFRKGTKAPIRVTIHEAQKRISTGVSTATAPNV